MVYAAMNRRWFLQKLSAAVASINCFTPFGAKNEMDMFGGAAWAEFDYSDGTVFQDLEGKIPANPGDPVARIDPVRGFKADSLYSPFLSNRPILGEDEHGRRYVEVETEDPEFPFEPQDNDV